jgi:sugar lactone lactonase YvrE
MSKINLSVSSVFALVFVCLITLGVTSAAYAAEQYSLVGKWGSRGSGEGKFSQPLDLAIDSSGNVYVTDFTGIGNQIQKFTANGTFITSWGNLGFGNGRFTNPAGIAIDSSGNVYVSDNNRVQKFDSNGKFITNWTVSSPFGIAVDSGGKVYVIDQTTGGIQIYGLRSS